MKTAFLFPGQGSQHTGMGRELYESSPVAREMMEQANDILGFRITDLMFGEDEQALTATEVTQPAIFLHSVCKVICDSSLPEPDFSAGHSLGEYSALVAAGAMDFADGLSIVSVRAREMQKCCEAHPGLMAAIIAMEPEKVEEICAATEGVVVPANFNGEGQIVISGEEDAVLRACDALKAAGAKRALPLKVGGAFHSPLMEPARSELAKAIAATDIRAPKYPVYQNVTALPETDPARIRENLLAQLTSPVRWTQTIRRMFADGADTFFEAGPGEVLRGILKRMAKSSGTEITLI